jgi:2-polyprenyl-3-methyl-5-hydroxy-6-metoxy-1,4-benzoquinol methylase
MSDISKVRDYFIRSADSFDLLYSEERMNRIMRYINRKFRNDIYERFLLTLTHLKNNNLRSVLDVGCGSGRYEVAISQLNVEKIIGRDVSPKMIDLAGNYIKSFKETSKKVEFICCDFSDFISDDKFDIVIAMGFFDYVKDPILFLKKMKDLSNQSVVASFPSISFYRTPIRQLRYYFKNCPVYFYSKNQIVHICKETGFSSCEVIKIKGDGMDYFVKFFK